MLIQERLQLVLKMHNLTPSAFADKIGVQRSNISHVLSGRNKPSLDFLEKILLNFPRVNAHWLITGEVVEGKQEQLKTVQTEQNTLDLKNNPESIEKDAELKKVERIVVFYVDSTFKEYTPKT